MFEPVLLLLLDFNLRSVALDDHRARFPLISKMVVTIFHQNRLAFNEALYARHIGSVDFFILRSPV